MIDHNGAWTEAEFQAEVIKLIKERGYLYHHCAHPYRCQGENGLVDLIVIGNSGVLWLELKTSLNSLREPQIRYKEALQRANQQYRVMRPKSLYDGSMTLLLDSLR
jgi:hypothetical protein